MHSHSQDRPQQVHNDDQAVEADVDNDPGNEDPGSQFDRDATVPLIDTHKRPRPSPANPG